MSEKKHGEYGFHLLHFLLFPSFSSMSLQGKQLLSVAHGADGLRGAHIPLHVWHTSEVAGDWLCICQQLVVRETCVAMDVCQHMGSKETEGTRKHQIYAFQSTSRICCHLVGTACRVSRSLIGTHQFQKSPKFSFSFLGICTVRTPSEKQILA